MSSKLVSVRLTDNLLVTLDKWADENSLSRSAAINYLLARKLSDELRKSPKDVLDGSEKE